jgi:signal transduction histidine kinase
VHELAREPFDCQVIADRVRLQQILLNLLANAIKYNRPDGHVAVSCHAGAESVRIDVRDTGHGLSAEQQQRLFRAFERLGADTTPVEGTGIGLALSRRLAQAMAGEIGVDSELLLGAAGLCRQGARQWCTRHTVLYIEDNPVNQALMEGMLGQRPGIG